jgi:hypothetical protein
MSTPESDTDSDGNSFPGGVKPAAEGPSAVQPRSDGEGPGGNSFPGGVLPADGDAELSCARGDAAQESEGNEFPGGVKPGGSS